MLINHNNFIWAKWLPQAEKPQDLSDKAGTKALRYAVCHTYIICDTIWPTAVWTSHKEQDGGVPSHFHSWSERPLYIFLQRWWWWWCRGGSSAARQNVSTTDRNTKKGCFILMRAQEEQAQVRDANPEKTTLSPGRDSCVM